MANPEQQQKNLFVQELVQILDTRGLKLEQLVDLVGIPPDKIKRLQKSLHDPTFAPLLNPDEMEQLVTALFIDRTEQKRLQAALLATAVQRLLKGQIDLTDAQKITQQIHPLLLDAIIQSDLDLLKNEKRVEDHDAREDVDTDLIWAIVLDALDAADLALQLSRGPVPYMEQVRKLQEARICLEEALAELERMDKAIKSLPIWRTRHQKASRDHRAVIKYLQTLGEMP